jgi:hypothetical protein
MLLSECDKISAVKHTQILWIVGTPNEPGMRFQAVTVKSPVIQQMSRCCDFKAAPTHGPQTAHERTWNNPITTFPLSVLLRKNYQGRHNSNGLTWGVFPALGNGNSLLYRLSGFIFIYFVSPKIQGSSIKMSMLHFGPGLNIKISFSNLVPGTFLLRLQHIFFLYVWLH